MKLRHLLLCSFVASLWFSSQAQTEEDWQKQGYKPIYSLDFEDMVRPEFTSDTVVLNGIRWRIINGRIEEGYLQGVPQGNKALVLKAFFDPSQPDQRTALEMIEDFTMANVGVPDRMMFRVDMAGLDGILPDRGWKIAFLYDGDVTGEWGYDNIATPSAQGNYSVQFPERANPSGPMRVKIYYDGDTNLEGQRLLLDDIKFYASAEYGFGKPTFMEFMNIRDGYATSKTTIPVKMDYNSDHGITDPADPYPSPIFDSFVRILLDGKEYTELHRISNIDPYFPLEYDFVLQDIAPGQHTLEAVLCKLDGTPWGPDKQSCKVSFTCGAPVTKIQGLSALQGGTVGTFYEVTPASPTDSIFCGMYQIYRNQRYLFDKEGSIRVDDPWGHNAFKFEIPDKGEYVESMIGQLVQIDGNLLFAIDDTVKYVSTGADFNAVMEKFPFLSADYSSFISNPAAMEGRCLILQGTMGKDLVGYQVKAGQKGTFTNGTQTIPLYTYHGTRLSLNTGAEGLIYPDYEMYLLGVVVRHPYTQEYSVSPIMWEKTIGVEQVVAANEQFRARGTSLGELLLTAPQQCTATVYSLDGTQQAVYNFSGSKRIVPNLSSGAYLVTLRTATEYTVCKVVLGR